MKSLLSIIIWLSLGFSVFAQDINSKSLIEKLNISNRGNEKISVVLDTDAYNEIDDQFAISYLLLSDERFIVEGIYAAPYFNDRSDSPKDGMIKSYDEILRLLDLLGSYGQNINVQKGSDNYLTDLARPIESDAAKDLIEKAKLRSEEDPLYVVAIGCATNVASAILLEPSIIDNIVIVWLGGNSLEWPNQREFNLYQDILSGRVLLDSGAPLIITPCRPVVSHFRTTNPELEYYLRGKNELSNYLIDIFKDYNQDGLEAWSKEIWDVVPIAYLVNPDWVSMNTVHSPILTDQATYSFDSSRHFINMAVSINRDAIFRDLFHKLAKLE